MQVWSLSWEDPLEENMVTILQPGESHGQRSLVGYIVYGVAKGWTRVKQLSTPTGIWRCVCMHAYIHIHTYTHTLALHKHAFLLFFKVLHKAQRRQIWRLQISDIKPLTIWIVFKIKVSLTIVANGQSLISFNSVKLMLVCFLSASPKMENCLSKIFLLKYP